MGIVLVISFCIANHSNPQLSGIKQPPFYFAHTFYGSGIQTGHCLCLYPGWLGPQLGWLQCSFSPGMAQLLGLLTSLRWQLDFSPGRTWLSSEANQDKWPGLLCLFLKATLCPFLFPFVKETTTYQIQGEGQRPLPLDGRRMTESVAIFLNSHRRIRCRWSLKSNKSLI